VDEVLAQPAGGLGPVEEFGEGIGGKVALLLEGFRGGESHGEHIGEATVVGLHLADPFNEPAEAVPRIGVGQRVIDSGRIGTHLVRECRPHQFIAGGEATEEGGHAHPGPAGYLIGGSVQTLLSEHLASRPEHPLPVPLGIGPKPPLRGRCAPLSAGVIAHVRTLPTSGIVAPLTASLGQTGAIELLLEAWPTTVRLTEIGD
jgi:hypothetical protein